MITNRNNVPSNYTVQSHALLTGIFWIFWPCCRGLGTTSWQLSSYWVNLQPSGKSKMAGLTPERIPCQLQICPAFRPKLGSQMYGRIWAEISEAHSQLQAVPNQPWPLIILISIISTVLVGPPSDLSWSYGTFTREELSMVVATIPHNLFDIFAWVKKHCKKIK